MSNTTIKNMVLPVTITTSCTWMWTGKVENGENVNEARYNAAAHFMGREIVTDYNSYNSEAAAIRAISIKIRNLKA